MSIEGSAVLTTACAKSIAKIGLRPLLPAPNQSKTGPRPQLQPPAQGPWGSSWPRPLFRWQLDGFDSTIRRVHSRLRDGDAGLAGFLGRLHWAAPGVLAMALEAPTVAPAAPAVRAESFSWPFCTALEATVRAAEIALFA